MKILFSKSFPPFNSIDIQHYHVYYLKNGYEIPVFYKKNEKYKVYN